MCVRACVRASSRFLLPSQAWVEAASWERLECEWLWGEDGRQRPLGGTRGRREFPTRIKVERSEEVETTQRHQVRTNKARDIPKSEGLS